MKTIKNPILKGFNPDPSILRVGEDYYIATSTFQWWPGVAIHHSRDLINWRLLTYPLTRVSQLDMNGVGDSGGIWAPCLSYHNGLFYLIYTNVVTNVQHIKDAHNYLVTAKEITGEWSEPVYLNSTGFDPSIFFDDDGKSYILNMLWDSRHTTKAKFAGILMQEYDCKQQRLIGKPVNIFKGTELTTTEAPNMYKRNGWYILLCAEGGTGRTHAVTAVRSKNIWGPYEVHPQNPILTSKDDLTQGLQRAGHASIVETQNGEWYMAYLCSRPLYVNQGFRSVLGRETAIQKIVWKDGWPYLESGGNRPQYETPAPDLPEHKFEATPERDHFDSDTLDINFMSLRKPLPNELCNTTERKGYLRLRGAETLASCHTQSLIARRWQAFCFVAETCVEFEPETFLQCAGLIALYDTGAFYYLKISHDEELGKCVSVVAKTSGELHQPREYIKSVEGCSRVYLRVEVNREKLNFFYSKDGTNWLPIGETYDASLLSDESPASNGSFTGAFVGLCAQDATGASLYADFDYFDYKEQE